MYIHLFSFYCQASNHGVKYNIHSIVSIGETTYRDILLGACLENMGIRYKSKESLMFQQIKHDMLDSRLKVGRFITQNENITADEIKNVLNFLGHNLNEIYLKPDEIEFFENLEF